MATVSLRGTEMWVSGEEKELCPEQQRQHSESSSRKRIEPDLNTVEIKAACCKFICELEPEGTRERGKRESEDEGGRRREILARQEV